MKKSTAMEVFGVKNGRNGYEEVGVAVVLLSGELEEVDELGIYVLDLFDGELSGQGLLVDEVGVEGNVFIILVVEHPVLHVVHRVDFVEDVGAGDAQSQEGVEVLGVNLHGFLRN
jgi:hypothetical protein